MTGIAQFGRRGDRVWAVLTDDGARALGVGLAELLRLPLDSARGVVERAAATGATVALDDVRLLAPVDRQPVWAAGVTYERSLLGRVEESSSASLYDHVYSSSRPELFFKCTAEQVVPPGESVGIRADSDWNVPEPEVGVVLTCDLDVFGFTIGNDMSSRSIEGENALYLPQAKVFDKACALGPRITPAWEVSDDFEIELEVVRDGRAVLAESTSTSRLRRSWTELAEWLGKALTFPDGVVLLSGTGIVPERAFTLAPNDVVTIRVGGIGELRNHVTVVGKSSRVRNGYIS